MYLTDEAKKIGWLYGRRSFEPNLPCGGFNDVRSAFKDWWEAIDRDTVPDGARNVFEKQYEAGRHEVIMAERCKEKAKAEAENRQQG